MMLLGERSPWTSTRGAWSSSGIQYFFKRSICSMQLMKSPPLYLPSFARTILRCIFAVISPLAEIPSSNVSSEIVLSRKNHEKKQQAKDSIPTFLLNTQKIQSDIRNSLDHLVSFVSFIVSLHTNGFPSTHPKHTNGLPISSFPVSEKKRTFAKCSI
jgi:hypothetical protein